MNQDDFLDVVEACYSCASDPQQWEPFLQSLSTAIGGVSALIVTIDITDGTHRIFRSWNLPPTCEMDHLEDYAAISPRLPFGLRQGLGENVYDYLILSEDQMAEDPFYAEFLPQQGFRYFVSGVIHQDERLVSVISVQRSEHQGHAERKELFRLAVLLPHIRQAFDLTLRIERAERKQGELVAMLDRLSDGAVLVAGEGLILFANDAARALLDDGDGVSARDGGLWLGDPEARRLYVDALLAIAHRRSGFGVSGSIFDFPAKRPSGAKPFIVAVRTLPPTDHTEAGGQAVAGVFIRDPEPTPESGPRALRELYGLTAAEADFAVALRTGLSVSAYAALRGLSVNTVYTHLRHIKDKTGTNRQPDLVREFNRSIMNLRPEN